MRNILFLCTGNSCRSVLAEAYLNHVSTSWRAYSAGSHPTGVVHPMARKILGDRGIDVSDARSKTWEEFSQPDAPHMEIIVTVCDSAAGETCPIWPGHPTSHHWPFPDPAHFQGSPSEVEAYFLEVFEMISRKIDFFLENQVAHDA
jgi:arsenate reductase